MSSAPQKKVAVIAIHGISDQKPHHTAREVADMINMLPTEPGQELYESSPDASEEHILRIPVRMAKPWEADEHTIEQQAHQKPKRKSLKSFGSGLKSITSSGRSLIKVRPRQDENSFGHIDEDDLLAELESDFLNDQLAGYAPHPPCQQECEHYRTIRIDQDLSSLTPSSASGDITTHVYEMYWGDLSRLGTGAFALFNEFFQLLFHLASLGQHVVTSGYEEASARYAPEADSECPAPESWELQEWRWYMRCQELAVALISLIIPLGSLHLLVLMGVTLIGRLPIAYDWRLLVFGLIPAMALFGCLLSSGLAKRKFGRGIWVLLGLAVAVITGFLPQLQKLAKQDSDPWFLANLLKSLPLNLTSIDNHLTISWVSYLLIAALIGFGPVAAYEKRRPGALAAHLCIAGSIAIIFLGVLIHTARTFPMDQELWGGSASHYAVSYASFKVIEVLYLVLAAVWAVFYFVQLGCWSLGQWVEYRVTQMVKSDGALANPGLKNWKTRIKRCNTTARMTLAASTAIYFVITTGLWTGLSWLDKRLHILPTGVKNEWYSVSNLFQQVYQLQADKLSSQQFMQELLLNIMPMSFGFNLVLLLVAVLVVIWALLPSVLREGAMPEKDHEASLLGQWLDQGFQTMVKVGEWFLVLNMVGIVPLGFALGYRYKNQSPQLFSTLKLISAESCSVVLIAIPILFVAVVVSEGLRSKLRGVLDAILDVDNYLRIHPVTDNPRSRIFARYISLLRHIATQDYDGIVIVAHSQGSVISADVLRFLQREAKHSLNTQGQNKPRGLQADPIVRDLVQGDRKIPITLFTMGAPIHQLYSRAFPHLYHWAAHYDDLPNKPNARRASNRPNPSELGVYQWVNAYGSGDYVGRYLWGQHEQMFNVGEKLLSGHDECYEFCLSDGAHTHYWDGTRRKLADTIQQLVSAIAHPQRPPQPPTGHVAPPISTLR